MGIDDIRTRIAERRQSIYFRTNIEDLTTKSPEEIVNLMSPAEREYIRRVMDKKMAEVAAMHDMYFISETDPIEPIVGTHWYNPSTSNTVVWNGEEWATNSSFLRAAVQKYNYDAEEGDTVFLATYTEGDYLEVYRNGFKLPPQDYDTTESHGIENEIHLKTGANDSDKIEIISFQPFQASYVYDDKNLINSVKKSNSYYEDLKAIVDDIDISLLGAVADLSSEITDVSGKLTEITDVSGKLTEISAAPDYAKQAADSAAKSETSRIASVSLTELLHDTVYYGLTLSTSDTLTGTFEKGYIVLNGSRIFIDSFDYDFAKNSAGYIFIDGSGNIVNQTSETQPDGYVKLSYYATNDTAIYVATNYDTSPLSLKRTLSQTAVLNLTNDLNLKQNNELFLNIDEETIITDANKNITIFADTTSAEFTIYLKENPLLGDRIIIIDNKHSFSTNNITVMVPNDSVSIMGSTNKILMSDDSKTEFIFDGTEYRMI